MKTVKKLAAHLLPNFVFITAMFGLGINVWAQDPTRSLESDNVTLIAASNMLHPPFSSWDAEKRAVGIEVDIVNAAAASLSKKVQWIEKPFGQLLDSVAAGEIDVAVSTIGITESRKKLVAFSRAYYETKIVALVSPDSKFEALDDLATARIGADKATSAFVAAAARWPNAKLVGEVEEGKKWPDMIESGFIDALIVDASDQSRLQSQSAIKLFRLEGDLKSEQFAVVVNRKASQLRAAINEQIKKQRNRIELKIGGEYQFTTPIGQRLTSLEAPDLTLIENYQQARAKYRANPNDADAVIWYGRRAGYLMRLNEAIQIFSIGIEKHPNDPRMYRHRGHRYISTRRFDKAIVDLEKAVELIVGKPNRKEPDGAPNAQGIELTTTHGNIWYHLGLAYYFKNDMFNARRCFEQCLKITDNDDGIVPASHWLYMILRRMGQYKQATQLMEKIRPNMTIIENKTYHQMCLMYGGKATEAELLKPDDDAMKDDMRQSVADVLLYGIGNWHQYHLGDQRRCRTLYERLLADGSPFSFAFIAAESDYVRMFANR